jgi:hypothetical protein
LKALVLIAPLLLGACTGSWPAQSYVNITADPDAAVLAPAISDCIAEIVPPMSVITLPALTNAVGEVLAGDLQRNGLTQRPDGVAVAYLAAPVDAGAFIRVTAAKSSCSQYFFRASDALHVGGPQTVLKNG